MKHVCASIAALVIACLVFAHSAQASSSTPQPPVRLHGVPAITIPCGNTQVPYSVYSMAITQPETLTLTFQASGAGLITFTANNYQDFYWSRTDGSCGNCTLVLPNVQPGPHSIMQLAADASADACPSGGLTVSNFQLQISPSNPTK